MHKLYTIVDKNDNIIGYKSKSETTKSDIYRVSVLVLYNSKQEILLAQRALTKSHDPGKWGFSAVGTVEKNETYEENIIKEAKEEIGLDIDNSQLIKGSKYLHKENFNFFYQLFYYKLDRLINEFSPRLGEVKDIRWINVNDLLKDTVEHPEKYVVKTGKISKDLLEKKFLNE